MYKEYNVDNMIVLFSLPLTPSLSLSLPLYSPSPPSLSPFPLYLPSLPLCNLFLSSLLE